MSLSPVSAAFQAAWRSGQHVGDKKPTCKVYVRRGRLFRGYDSMNNPPNVRIEGSTRNRPWQARYEPYESFLELPAVLECNIEQGFDANGIAVATLQIENVQMVEKSGLAGIYHLIDRGRLSPWRGYRSPRRPNMVGEKNEWYERLISNAQVKVFEGYGSNLEPTFVGLIDEVDWEAAPDRITLACRDMGQILTDQSMFGWAVDKALKDPVTFIMRDEADERTQQGRNGRASSERNGHPARFVHDDDPNTRWISSNHTTAGVTEWVQVTLPRGTYRDIVLHPAYPGMECYVGIYARGNSKRNGVALPEGFVAVGEGSVPGAHGGWPFINRFNRTSDKSVTHDLNGHFELDDGCVLRVGFRNLYRIQTGVYRAGVRKLQGVKRVRKQEAKSSKTWVIMDDPADMVRCLLMWSGFKEWDVENVGTGLEGKWTFDANTKMIDPIIKLQEATGYVFFVVRPTSQDDSMGIPVFRSNQSLTSPSGLQTVRDTDLLTGIKVRVTDEPLPSIIRIRGDRDKRGKTLGGERTKRLMAVYRPPWAALKRIKTKNDRHAGIIKHVIRTDKHLKKQQECEVLARLTALQSAFASCTATIEIPGHPGFSLDEQIVVIDNATGMGTRLYIAQRSSAFRSGANASYKTTLGGALLDTPDVQDTMNDIRDYLAKSGSRSARVGSLKSTSFA